MLGLWMVVSVMILSAETNSSATVELKVERNSSIEGKSLDKNSTAEENLTKNNSTENNVTKNNLISKKEDEALKKQMEREKKYAREQVFYQGSEYDLSSFEVDKSSLDKIPLIEPDYDFDMDDVYD
jgi:carbohydrate-binding DOMON domain-containing protein